MTILPDDRLYLTLAALRNACGGRIDTESGQEYAHLEVSDTQLCAWPLAPGELDRLESWGWIELLPPPPDKPNAAPVQVTDKGVYWLCKWLKKNHKRLPKLLQHFAIEQHKGS